MDLQKLLDAVKSKSTGNSNFDKAILNTLKNEGGFVNDPKDPGGATNFGLSIRYLQARGDLDHDGFMDGDLDHNGTIDINDIKNMTVEQAISLYKSGFWDANGYDAITDSTVAARVFDMTVNMGSKQTGKIVQRALADIGRGGLVDGIIGKNTFLAINASDPATLMNAIRAEHKQFYLDLIAAKPELAKFKNGWLARAAQ